MTIALAGLSGLSNSKAWAGQSSIAKAAPGSDILATETALSLSGPQTVFRLRLSRGVTAEVFTQDKPNRVIIDLPGVDFRLPEGTGESGEGLVTAYRFGQVSAGKARLVLDAKEAVKITRAQMLPAEGASPAIDLIVELQATRVETAGVASPVTPVPAPPETEALAPKHSAGHKPVIVIDPGHGGIDGGAVGTAQLIEKNVVLTVALELKKELEKSGRFEVRTTRASDMFVSLDRRVQMSRDFKADLFVSLHADSIADVSATQSVRGATVYTLSERASDEQARIMAEKENASDLIAGLGSSDSSAETEVKSILIDLMKRETANYSAEFSKTLLGSLRRSVQLARETPRSAAFKVLKQTHAPAVLVELGYLSHDEDQKLLGSADWRRKMARSIADAVEKFFAKRG